ncbi:deaminase [Actinorhabdospora filicis]|uniref:Deaminase n=1 Tax=Actinorhabdospora filicis TaxID=1785913 RepID=A0A9W6W905_9ACTN|nr:dihydrofolate reductase family protein [Actinorhabdospora filicis]GLZ76175.1 deaminase [Actinorhabdospora filicis]
MRRLTYFIATSLDGFIADPSGSLAPFFPLPDGMAEYLVGEYPETLPAHLHEPMGVGGSSGRFDAVLMGRGAWEPGLAEGVTSPYSHLDQYVFSSTLGAVDGLTVVPGDAVAAVRELKSREGGGIWLLGGGRLAGALAGEIDELIVKVYPLVLGEGRPVFEGGRPERLTLDGTRPIGSGGAVELRYSSR